MIFDVILYDSIGMPLDWSKPLGGTEAGHVLLAQALRDEGLRVRIMQEDERAETRALILSRWSPLPKLVTWNRAVVMAHDLWRKEYRDNQDLGSVCVSHYQQSDFDEHSPFPAGFAPHLVVRPILGDHVRALKGTRKVRGRWIYPTAVNKGLEASLRAWREVAGRFEYHELLVTSSGYDEPPAGLCEEFGAQWIGKLAPEDLARAIAQSQGLFYVNTAPECFPMTVAIARELGLQMHVRCDGHGHCGIAEALVHQDLRPATIARQWIELLRLGNGR